MKNKVAEALRLETGERIVAAYAEAASGPGWSNSPIWVLIHCFGSYRLACIQPDEQTPEIAMLYSVSSVAHAAMTAAVMRAARGKEGA
jgi:hypothetical protein